MRNSRWYSAIFLLALVLLGFMFIRSKVVSEESWFNTTSANVKKVAFDKGLSSLSGLVKSVKPSVVNISTTTVVKGPDLHERFSANQIPSRIFSEMMFMRNFLVICRGESSSIEASAQAL